MCANERERKAQEYSVSFLIFLPPLLGCSVYTYYVYGHNSPYGNSRLLLPIIQKCPMTPLKFLSDSTVYNPSVDKRGRPIKYFESPHVRRFSPSLLSLRNRINREAKMTSVDSGVETGNDSNDSMIVQHESQQQQQQQQYGVNSNQNTDNGVATVATANSNEIGGNKQEASDLNLFHIKLDIPVDLMSTAVGFYLASQRESMLVTDHTMGVRMSNPEMMPERRTTYKTNRNIYPVLGHKAARLKRYGGHMHDSSVNYLLQVQGRKMRFAAATNNTAWMKQLLEEGISPNIPDDYGRTPLHHAASRGYTDIVRLLLNYGANPNHEDCVGNTPLYLATVTRKDSIVTLLLSGDYTVLDDYDYNAKQLMELKLNKLKNVKTCEDLMMVRQDVRDIMTILEASANMKENMREQVETLSNICSRLSLSNSDQVQDDIKDLLANINNLRITSNRPGCNASP